MRDPDNIREVLDLAPDFMGFIFFQGSPRYAGPQAEEIGRIRFPAEVAKVGVFVNETPGKILKLRDTLSLRYAQLHGTESVSICRELKQQHMDVIKVVSVGNVVDFERMRPYEEFIDYFLFDTKGKNFGGNSISFNWDLIREYPFEKPFFLGGGVGLDSLPDVEKIEIPLLYALDVNSRLESSPGVKDIEKVRTFKNKLNKINDRSEHRI